MHQLLTPFRCSVNTFGPSITDDIIQTAIRKHIQNIPSYERCCTRHTAQTFPNERRSRSCTGQTSQAFLRSARTSQKQYKRQQTRFGQHPVKTMLPQRRFAATTTITPTDKEFTTRLPNVQNHTTHSDEHTVETSTDND